MDFLNDKLVSVIISVFNDEPFYLTRALESLISQTYKNIEIILCNDGSTSEQTNHVLEEYSKRKKFIYIINENNLGLADSLNKCIENSHGEYIARMDGDDISLPDRIEKEVQFLESHSDIDFVSSNAKVINEDDKVFGLIKFTSNPTLKDVVRGVNFVHPGMMFRKSIFYKYKYESSELTKQGRCEDYDFWCRLYYNNLHGCNIDECLLLYRETKENYKKRTRKSRFKLIKCKKLWFKKTKNITHDNGRWLIKDKILALLPKCISNKLHVRKINYEYKKFN